MTLHAPALLNAIRLCLRTRAAANDSRRHHANTPHGLNLAAAEGAFVQSMVPKLIHASKMENVPACRSGQISIQIRQTDCTFVFHGINGLIPGLNWNAKGRGSPFCAGRRRYPILHKIRSAAAVLAIGDVHYLVVDACASNLIRDEYAK